MDLYNQIISTPIPKETRTYKPVPHENVINTIRTTLNEQGMSIANENYTIKEKGKIITGDFIIKGNDTNVDFQKMLSFINSYNKKKRLCFASGTNTYICTNGCIFGDEVYMTKHMGTVREDMRQVVEEQIKKMTEKYTLTIQKFGEWKEIKVNSKEMAQLAGLMAWGDPENRILLPNQVERLGVQIHQPSYDYGGKNNTMYEFYQHVTHAIKDVHPMHKFDLHNKVFKFVDNQVLVG